jgi:hypothetical protein
MKNLIKTVISVLLVSIIVISCKKDVADPTVDCSTSQSRDMEGFFNALHSSPNYDLYETMDLLTHEFTFTTTGTLQICGFGYKSQGTSLNYTIELVDNNATALYTGNHSFSNTQYDYISIAPLTINAGTYTLRRTITNNANLSDTIGPITRGAGSTNPTFPINLGPNITINSANFYGTGGPVPNYGVPNIYFEYIEL